MVAAGYWGDLAFNWERTPHACCSTGGSIRRRSCGPASLVSRKTDGSEACGQSEDHPCRCRRTNEQGHCRRTRHDTTCRRSLAEPLCRRRTGCHYQESDTDVAEAIEAAGTGSESHRHNNSGQTAECHSREHTDAGEGTGAQSVDGAPGAEAAGLKPHLIRTFKLSNDPKFVEKMTDIVGPYLAPPNKALVLCVDEKSPCQTLERTQKSLPCFRDATAR